VFVLILTKTTCVPIQIGIHLLVKIHSDTKVKQKADKLLLVLYVTEANNTENAHFFHFFKLKLFDTFGRVIYCSFVYEKNLPEIENKAKAERPRKTPLVSVYGSVCVSAEGLGGF
jgi:hypothetical protein